MGRRLRGAVPPRNYRDA